MTVQTRAVRLIPDTPDASLWRWHNRGSIGPAQTDFVIREANRSASNLIVSKDDNRITFTVSARRPLAPPAQQSEQLAKENNQLRQRIARLEAEVGKLGAALASLIGQPVELREISKRQARKEIKEYFEAHHGEILYASDIADALRLDYHDVSELLNELRASGEIREATS